MIGAMRHLCVLAGLAITSSALATPPQRTIVTLDQTVSAIDERPIRYYIDRPSIDERVPLLVVVDGSGCVGQKRPSSWGSYAPKPDDAIPFARVMVEKPGVEPFSADHDAECSEDFLKHYTIQNRVLDHMRVLQHLSATAEWWNGQLLIWGWSDGGDVAAQIVIYHPGVERAVLGAMGGGLTMAEHFENFWACPAATTENRELCLEDLRNDFQKMEDNPTWKETWSGTDNSWRVWATRLRSRLSAPLSDNRTPILIVHGELDRDNTPVESARALVSDLTQAGNDHFNYWEIVGMGHGWNDLPPDRQVALHGAMLDWLLTSEVDPDRKALAISGGTLDK